MNTIPLTKEELHEWRLAELKNKRNQLRNPYGSHRYHYGELPPLPTTKTTYKWKH